MEKRELIRLKTIIAICCLVFIAPHGTFAQSNKKYDLSRALKVGDTFVPPDHLEMMRGNLEKLDWHSMENKVIVLDFFDTFCGTCIGLMPKLQDIQNRHSDMVQIISVTWQDRATMERFFEKNTYLKENQVNLPVVYADTYFRSLFPHQSVPHVALLYKGRVQAISSSDFVTGENITVLYETGSIDLPTKDDFGKVDLFQQFGNSGSGDKVGMVLTTYQDGVAGQALQFERDSLTGLYRTSVYNMPLYNILLAAWARVRKPNYIPRPERVIWKVKDKSRYIDTAGQGESWVVKNALCYERVDWLSRSDSAQARVFLKDLHSFMGINSYPTKHKLPCLVLLPCPVKPDDRKDVGKKMNFGNSSVLAGFLDISGKFPPVVDKVKLQRKIAVGAYDTLEQLNEQLAAYGIVAVPGEEELEVLVIEEVPDR